MLSLWPDRAIAPGPPSGSPRVSSDPRADLDSAVLLTRSLLADTRQLAAQMVGYWRDRAGAVKNKSHFFLSWAPEDQESLGFPSQLLSHQRDKFPADGDHNLDSLPTLAMSAGTLGSLQVRAAWQGGVNNWRRMGSMCQLFPNCHPWSSASRCADKASSRLDVLPPACPMAAQGRWSVLEDSGARAGCPASPAGPATSSPTALGML